MTIKYDVQENNLTFKDLTPGDVFCLDAPLSRLGPVYMVVSGSPTAVNLSNGSIVSCSHHQRVMLVDATLIVKPL